MIKKERERKGGRKEAEREWRNEGWRKGGKEKEGKDKDSQLLGNTYPGDKLVSNGGQCHTDWKEWRKSDVSGGERMRLDSISLRPCRAVQSGENHIKHWVKQGWLHGHISGHSHRGLASEKSCTGLNTLDSLS